jgi:branched-chain amino acid aminotransferase
MIIDALDINIQKVSESRLTGVDFQNLPFGRVFSDHMFIMNYRNGKWEQARIEGYRALSISPATSVLHYGQAIFEGLKAHKSNEGEVLLFRPEENAKRLNQSAFRMCMPEIPESLFMEGLTKLIDIDRGWVPQNEGSALYIRPFMMAIDEYVGIRPSDNYSFIIFTCPVNAYYTEPLHVKIEEEYSRAAPGGTGFAKASGNYAASLYPAKLAQKEGYRQLIWTDSVEHKYIEESGTMNVCFVIGNRLITPKSSDTILSGITKDSVTTIASEWGLEVEDRKVTVEEIVQALEDGTLKEAFGAGTAATIAQIESITFRDTTFTLPDREERVFSNKMYKYLDDLKRGKVRDPYSWTIQV